MIERARHTAVEAADWIADTFLRWSKFWSDISEAVLTGRSIDQVRADREKAE